MTNLILFGAITYLLLSSSKANAGNGDNTAAAIAFPIIEGGKNLVYNKLPLNEFGLPITIQVYSADFPLQEGDIGNVIMVLQQMICSRDFVIPITGVFDAATRNAWNPDWGGQFVYLDEFIAYATEPPSIVGKVEIFDFKPPIL